MSILSKIPQRIVTAIYGRQMSLWKSYQLHAQQHHRSYGALFQLPDEYKAIQSKCRAIALKELATVAEEHDKNSEFPEEQILKLSQLGYMGMCIDQKYGGAGYDLLATVLAVEQISRCCPSTGIIISIHNCLYAELIQRLGTQEQINEFLTPFLTSGQIGVFALSEHDAGSDVANISMTATPDGDDYILNGVKAWVTSGYEARAGIFFATVDKSLGHKGIASFLVNFNTPGVMLGRKEEKMGIRASSTCDIILKDVRVPKRNILGEIGSGFEIAMQQLQLGRIGVAAQALGIAQTALDLSVKYARKRELFGQQLINMQLVKAKIAKMSVNLEAARLLTWKAATLRDTNQDFRKLSSMAKYSASKCATSNANSCVQILGGKGYVDGLAERNFRDARITQIYGGATDIQRLIIAEQTVNEYIKEEENEQLEDHTE